MSSLAEKLNALAGERQKAAPSAPVPDSRELYREERLVPPESLCGAGLCTLDEIQACDPLFEGRAWDLHRLLFLDTETTGLSGGAGTYAFEIGIGLLTERGLTVRQLVMPDMPGERKMLLEVADLARTHDILVTFNGKSFDIPLLESRMVMNGIRPCLSGLPHLDLLHVCRRIYRLRLKRCTLRSLEEAVLGKKREDDLPGSEAPERYFQYLRTGEYALLREVLRHNEEDVIALAQLMGHVCSVFRDPGRIRYDEDLYSVARTLEKSGKAERAAGCYRLLQRGKMAPQACYRLAYGCKRRGEWRQMEEICLEMIRSGQNGIWPYTEMAKHCEHAEKDYARALKYAADGMNALLDRMPPDGVSPEKELISIRRRIERLQRKQNRIRQGRQA